MKIEKFIKENKNLISDELKKKRFILEDIDFEEARTGVKEIFSGRSMTCSLVKDESMITVEGKQELINHTLPFRWVSIDFSFTPKRYELEINGKVIYYKYCVL
jgi:hypothetical protein